MLDAQAGFNCRVLLLTSGSELVEPVRAALSDIDTCQLTVDTSPAAAAEHDLVIVDVADGGHAVLQTLDDHLEQQLVLIVAQQINYALLQAASRLDSPTVVKLNGGDHALLVSALRAILPLHLEFGEKPAAVRIAAAYAALSACLLDTLPLSDRLQRAVDLIANALHSSGCHICLYDPQNDRSPLTLAEFSRLPPDPAAPAGASPPPTMIAPIDVPNTDSVHTLEITDVQPPNLTTESTIYFHTAARLIGTAIHRFNARLPLRTSDHLLRELVAQSIDGMMLLDSQGQIIAWNDALADLTGLPAEDMLGRPIWQTFFHQESASAPHLANAREQVEQMLGTGEVPFQESHRDLEIIRPDGETRSIRTVLSPIQLEDGWAASAIVRDVTDYVQAQRTVAASERTLSALLGNLSGVAYQCINEPEWWMTFISSAVTGLTGYSPEDFTSRRVAYNDLIHPDDRDAVWEAVQQAVAAGERFRIEYRIHTRSGEEKWVWEQGLLVTREDGQSVLEGFITDITRQKQADQALRDSEQRFRTVTEGAIAGVYIIQDNLFRYVNPALAEMFGYTVDELIDRLGPLDLTQPDDQSRVSENVRQRLEGKKSAIEYTFRGRRKDGATIYCHVMGSRATYRDRPAIVGTLLDITERRRAELAETRQRILTNALLDTANLINSTLNLDEVLERILINVERIVPHDAANIMLVENGVARVERFRGYPPGEIADGTAALSFVVDKTANLRVMVQTGEPLIIDDIQQRTGWVDVPSTRWMRAYAGAPIVVDGQVIGFISLDSADVAAFDQEIAETLGGFADQAGIAIRNARLYAEVEYYSAVLEEAIDVATAELRAMVDRVEAILNNSPDPTMLLTAEGRIELVNPAFEHIVGPGSEYAARLAPASVFTEESGAAIQQALDALQHSGDMQRVEAQAVSRGASPFEVVASLAPINDGDGLVGIVCTLHDISEMKELERLKDSFLSTAAHELRTPLTSIRGFSEILLTRSLEPDRQQTYLTFINQQAVNLGNIIDDLLDVSRLEAGRGLSMNLESTFVQPIVEGVLLPFAEISDKHTFVTSGLEKAPPVLADPFRLGQVFRNLVSNAVKYSPEGGEIRISAAVRDTLLEVRIADSGIGLTQEQQTHLFTPFYRADSAQQYAGGTGLGLSISRAIVEMHGGTISVNSVSAVGSTFTFTLPLASSKSAS